MPTYLCHGFRWHRALVRMFVAAHGLEDASPDWVVRPGAARGFADGFQAVFHFMSAADEEEEDNDDDGAAPPEAPFWMLEEYDARCLDAVSPPYAYIADYAVRVDSSVSVGDAVARYERRAARQRQRWQQQEQRRPRRRKSISRSRGKDKDVAATDEAAASSPLPAMTGPYADEGMAAAAATTAAATATADTDPEAATLAAAMAIAGTLRPGGVPSNGHGGWLEQLRDNVQPGEPIRWYVVVNDDEERRWRGEEDEEDEEDEEEDVDEARMQLRRDLGHPDMTTGSEETEDGDPDSETDEPPPPSRLPAQPRLPPPPTPPTPAPSTPSPALRHRKSLDFRAGGLRRLFGRSPKGKER